MKKRAVKAKRRSAPPFREFVDEHFKHADGRLSVTVARLNPDHNGLAMMARCQTVPLEDLRACAPSERYANDLEAVARTIDPAADMLLLVVVENAEEEAEYANFYLMRNARTGGVAEQLSIGVTVH